MGINALQFRLCLKIQAGKCFRVLDSVRGGSWRAARRVGVRKAVFPGTGGGATQGSPGGCKGRCLRETNDKGRCVRLGYDAAAFPAHGFDADLDSGVGVQLRGDAVLVHAGNVYMHTGLVAVARVGVHQRCEQLHQRQ
ncbi:MAG: hypothetical protein CMN57_07505 [Gammaproteobacteria bacterium]|nr:hypothetical protein [Gammaproteobacteria bacterium]